jgi:hypothetical protein
MTVQPLEAKDYGRMRKHGHADFAGVIKEVKGHLKSALADKQPVFALNYARMGLVDGAYVIEDEKSERLVLTESGAPEEPPSCYLLSLLPRELHRNQTLIARFHHNLDTGKLQIKPLSIVTLSSVVRLTF